MRISSRSSLFLECMCSIAPFSCVKSSAAKSLSIGPPSTNLNSCSFAISTWAGAPRDTAGSILWAPVTFSVTSTVRSSSMASNQPTWLCHTDPLEKHVSAIIEFGLRRASKLYSAKSPFQKNISWKPKPVEITFLWPSTPPEACVGIKLRTLRKFLEATLHILSHRVYRLHSIISSLLIAAINQACDPSGLR